VAADLHLPDVFVGVAFNAEPFDSAATPTWTDLTSRLVSIGSASRGRQYELDQNQTGNLSATWLNIDEALNPSNAGSPYSPNVQPYRQILCRAMWPNGGTGNLINLTGIGADPSFESYPNGAAAPSWLLTAGILGPTITTTNPFQGTKSLTYGVLASGITQGVGLVVPCIPGRTYTSTWYVRQTGANTTQIFVNGGAHGTSTTTTGVYVRLSLTWTATQPTHQLYVASFGTSVAGTVNVDAVQHEPGAVASAFTTTGPMIRNVWTRGYVERWPTTWDANGFEGWSSTPAVGPFAILANADLHAEARGAIMAKGPAYYWPLAEQSGATTFAEASGNGGPPLQRQDAATGPATFAPGTQTNIPGDPGGTGVALTGSTGANGSALNAGPRNTPGVAMGSPAAASWGVTIAFWLSSTDTGSFMAQVISTARSGSLSNGFSIGTIVQPYLLLVLGGNGVTTTHSAPAYNDGLPHLYVGTVALASNTIVANLYVDGVAVSIGSWTASTTFGTSTPASLMQWAEVGSQIDGYGSNIGVQGTYSHVGLWNRALDASEALDMFNAGRGYPGETSGARITRYLSLGGYTGPTSISAGTSTMGASTLAEGTSVLAACQAVADSEFGNFYESADGIAFSSRFSRYLATNSQYTFGENTAGGEYPYLGDIAYDFDPSRVFNVADVTRSGGVKAHAEAQDGGLSRKRFGPKPFTRTIGIASDAETQDAACWVVANGSAARQRVAAVTFDAAATRVPFGDGTLWPMLLSLEIGTRVTVKRRPKSANAGAGITMSGDFFVEQITHSGIDFEAGTWLVTLLLSPASAAQPWILQDATFGALGQTTVLGF
jgi:hypothetical protein